MSENQEKSTLENPTNSSDNKNNDDGQVDETQPKRIALLTGITGQVEKITNPLKSHHWGR